MSSYSSTGIYVDAVPPHGANVVSGMWLYKVKRPPGAPPVFKARYVARGFSQREGVDFFHTFAPTPKMTTLWVLLHIVAQRDYELHSLDFSIVFLQGSLQEQLWLRRPPGFTSSFPPGTQWQLRRPVYSLHQAPREWQDMLRTSLAALDFFPSSADPSMFVRCGSTPFFVLFYVDDLVFATPDRRALAFVKEELQRRHTCTDLGELQRYLGLQITRDGAARTITLTQSHMVDVLTHFVAPGRYQPSHWYAVKRVAKYVASTSGMGLVLGGKQPVILTGFSDSSWADDAMAAQELRWLSFLFTDLGERTRSPIVLFADNRSAVLLCEEPRLVGKPKHIQLCYFLLRELLQRGQALVRRVVSEANTADIFTKALLPCDHQRFCTQLGLVSTGPHLLTASEGLCVGAAATTSLAPAVVASSGAASQTAQLSFTLDSRASNCFFRDCTDLTPMRTPITVALADPSVGPVVARITTTLPCPAAPSGFLTGYYTPSFSRNLVGVTHLHDLGVVITFPLDEPVASCTVGAIGAPLATFHREPGSGLYSLHTGSHHSGSGQVRSSQTLHLDICGPSPVLGPPQERYFLIVVDDYSRYTTVFPLRRKADMTTVLEPWLLALGGAQGLNGLCLHSDHGVRYATHQLNLWPSDARPRVTPVSLWTGSPGVAADFRVWGYLAHVRAPGANNHLSVLRFSGRHIQRVCLLLQESPPPRSRPHRGTEVISPLLFLTLEPPVVAPVAPPPSLPAPSGAVAEGEGTGVARAGGVGSGGAGGLGVEVTCMVDTAASSQRPRPASPPGFPSVP
ncbi:unnamed protein product [Closterium sp. NIES-53]